jgi:hypothetical protein
MSRACWHKTTTNLPIGKAGGGGYVDITRAVNTFNGYDYTC